MVDRIPKPAHGPRSTIFKVQDYDLVPSAIEPRSRKKQGLLWPDSPEAAEVATVDPYVSLAPPAHVKECIARLRDHKASAIEGRLCLWSIGFLMCLRPGLERQRVYVVERQRVNLPSA